MDEFEPGDVVAHQVHGSLAFVGRHDDHYVCLHPTIGRVWVGTNEISLLIPRRAADRVAQQGGWPVTSLSVAGVAFWLFAQDRAMKEAAIRHFSRADASQIAVAAAAHRVVRPNESLALPLFDASRDADDSLTERVISEAALDFAARLQSKINQLDGLRSELGLQRVSPVDISSLAEHLREPAWSQYSSYCWRCREAVGSTVQAECPSCRWLVCVCGACRAPNHGGCTRYQLSRSNSGNLETEG